MLQNFETIIKTKGSKGGGRGKDRTNKGKLANSQAIKNHSKWAKGEATENLCKNQAMATT